MTGTDQAGFVQAIIWQQLLAMTIILHARSSDCSQQYPGYAKVDDLIESSKLSIGSLIT